MPRPKASLAAEIAALKGFYAALNQNDIEAVLKPFDPGIERVETFDPPTGSTCRGLAEFRAHVEKARATWVEGACEPRRFVASGDRIVVLVDVRVKVKGESQWRQGRVGDVFRFRSGKITEFHTFGEQQKALQWAGADAADAI